MTTIQEIKQLLSEDRFRIQLYDYLEEKLSIAISQINDEGIIPDTPYDQEEFPQRLEKYEKITSDLISIMALIGFWGSTHHQILFSLPTKYFSQHFGSGSGNNVWISLRWYPLILQMYSLGIGAVTAVNFKVLLSFFQATMSNPSTPLVQTPQILAMTSGFGRARETFKSLPDRDRQFTPLSEYLYDFFKTELNDVLFLGTEYEYIFDRFEILFALQHTHENEKRNPGRIWGPVGRFGWKFQQGVSLSPYKDLCDEASRAKELWPPNKSWLL